MGECISWEYVKYPDSPALWQMRLHKAFEKKVSWQTSTTPTDARKRRIRRTREISALDAVAGLSMRTTEAPASCNVLSQPALDAVTVAGRRKMVKSRSATWTIGVYKELV